MPGWTPAKYDRDSMKSELYPTRSRRRSSILSVGRKEALYLLTMPADSSIWPRFPHVPDVHNGSAFRLIVLARRDDPRIGDFQSLLGTRKRHCAMPDQTTTGHINTVSGPTIQRWIDRIFEIRVSQYTCRKETPKHVVRCFWLCHQNKGSLFLASKSPIESISCIQSPAHPKSLFVERHPSS